MATTLATHTAPPSSPGPERPRTKLSPADEQAFQQWYATLSQIWWLNPNPDDPLHAYDWRGGWQQTQGKPVIGPDGRPHWPSAFKDEDHPNRVIDGTDTATGEKVAPTGARNMPLAEYLHQLARGAGPAPGVKEGATETLQGLEGPTQTPPAGATRFLPATMTDAQPVHRQLDTKVEEHPEDFITQPNAGDVPRPGESYTEREADAFAGLEKTRRTLAPDEPGA